MFAQQLKGLDLVSHLVFFDKPDVIPIVISYVLHIQPHKGGGCVCIQLRDIQRLPVLVKHLADIKKGQPYAQVAAAEGVGAFLLDDGFDEVFVEMNKYTKQADVILKVVGRSMEPVIADGDRVLVRQQPSVRIGEIGVFIVDGQGYLKEYQADRLVSLNPDIDDVLVGELQNAECYGKFIKVLNPDWVK